MLILALDASGHTAGAALVTEEKVIAELTLNCGYTHSRTLMKLADDIVQLSDIELCDIDYVACTSGPGSFTGLRIGAACAKGLAMGLGKKMVNVSALDVLAYNVVKTSGYIASIMDARRGEVYAAVYEWAEGNTLTRVSDYIADKIEVVAGIAKEKYGDVTFAGDGTVPHREFLLHEGFNIAPLGHILQRPSGLGALAVKRVLAGDAESVINARDFKLFYIRKPQAEREMERKNV